LTKEVAPAVLEHPEARPTETLEGDTVDVRDYGGEPTNEQVDEVHRHLVESPVKVAVKQEDGSWSFWLERAVKAEAMRTSLREAEARFNHELLDDEERQLLLDRIKRIRRQLRLA
jgi:hypothetical protein